MAAVKAGFEESLFQALNGINLENVSISVEQKEAIRNRRRKAVIIFYLLRQVIDFSAIGLCF